MPFLDACAPPPSGQGDLEALRRAVASAPRGKREDCLLRIQMNGTEESPLYWAIQVPAGHCAGPHALPGHAGAY